MAKSNLLGLGIGFGILGLLLVGSAYLAFTDAFETFEDTEWDTADNCALDAEIFRCWIPMPSNDLGCFSCLFGILVVALAVGILFSGSIFGVVGATLDVSNDEGNELVTLPPPDSSEETIVVADEFAELESELVSFEFE
ncbi:MAG: hypothetical protein VYB40_02410 [Candidatus Thermoplasmatota archaeon]|nr:hypothetical protein [Candidatus Thermoplasmatota archaeon]